MKRKIHGYLVKRPDVERVWEAVDEAEDVPMTHRPKALKKALRPDHTKPRKGRSR